jgi:predicted nucleotidyltransferase
MILFGSYARGDFNIWSDIDILILNIDEYESLRRRRNPIIIECEKYGIKLIYHK